MKSASPRGRAKNSSCQIGTGFLFSRFLGTVSFPVYSVVTTSPCGLHGYIFVRAAGGTTSPLAQLVLGKSCPLKAVTYMAFYAIRTQNEAGNP